MASTTTFGAAAARSGPMIRIRLIPMGCAACCAARPGPGRSDSETSGEIEIIKKNQGFYMCARPLQCGHRWGFAFYSFVYRTARTAHLEHLCSHLWLEHCRLHARH